MPKFVIEAPAGTPPRLKIDTTPGEELTAEEAIVWMLNEIRLQLDNIDTRLCELPS